MDFPIEPILDRIIVKKDPAFKERKGNFHVPDSVKGRSHFATVVAVGPGRVNVETGEFIPLTVKAGDRVFLKEYDGYRFTLNGENYFIFSEAEIIGTIKEGFNTEDLDATVGEDDV